MTPTATQITEAIRELKARAQGHKLLPWEETLIACAEERLGFRELTDEEDVYWIRTNAEGYLTGALQEKWLDPLEAELELKDMKRHERTARLEAERRLEELQGITRDQQDQIRICVIECSGAPDSAIDGAGCDSGDPMDFTLTEIQQGFTWLKDQHEEQLTAERQKRDQILDDVLVMLAGFNIPTPERTYKEDGGWALALSAIRRAIYDRNQRIHALEAVNGRLAGLLKRIRDEAQTCLDTHWEVKFGSGDLRATIQLADQALTQTPDAALEGVKKLAEALQGFLGDGDIEQEIKDARNALKTAKELGLV